MTVYVLIFTLLGGPLPIEVFHGVYKTEESCLKTAEAKRELVKPPKPYTMAAICKRQPVQ